MLNYNMNYYETLCKAIEQLNLPDEKYKIYHIEKLALGAQKQAPEKLYGIFTIVKNKLTYLVFPEELEKESNIQNISRFILEEDQKNQIIIEKENKNKYYYYFDKDMKVKKKENKKDKMDEINIETNNYFSYAKYDYVQLGIKMKEHIKSFRLELLSTFKP